MAVLGSSSTDLLLIRLSAASAPCDILAMPLSVSSICKCCCASGEIGWPVTICHKLACTSAGGSTFAANVMVILGGGGTGGFGGGTALSGSTPLIVMAKLCAAYHGSTTPAIGRAI